MKIMLCNRLVIGLALAPLCTVAASAAAASTLTAVQILSRTKAASGGNAWSHIQSMRTESSKHINGQVSANTTLVDFRTRSYVSRDQVRGMTIATGFDGQSGWMAMPGQQPTPQNSTASVTGAYLASLGWLHPKQWHAKTVLVGKQVLPTGTDYVLKITPAGGSPVDLWVNAKTWLVDREVLASGSVQITTYLSDYRSVHGAEMAYDSRTVTVVAGRNVATTSQLKSVTFDVPVNAKDFALPGHA